MSQMRRKPESEQVEFRSIESSCSHLYVHARYSMCVHKQARTCTNEHAHSANIKSAKF